MNEQIRKLDKIIKELQEAKANLLKKINCNSTTFENIYAGYGNTHILEAKKLLNDIPDSNNKKFNKSKLAEILSNK